MEAGESELWVLLMILKEVSALVLSSEDSSLLDSLFLVGDTDSLSVVDSLNKGGTFDDFL